MQQKGCKWIVQYVLNDTRFTRFEQHQTLKKTFNIDRQDSQDILGAKGFVWGLFIEAMVPTGTLPGDK